MSEQNQTEAIQALSDQRVEIILGGHTYSARRATLYDIGLVNAFRARQEQANNPNIELDAELYILCELLKPNHELTPEQLAKSLPVAGILDVAAALERLGFSLPQETVNPSSGATSTPPSAS